MVSKTDYSLKQLSFDFLPALVYGVQTLNNYFRVKKGDANCILLSQLLTNKNV